MYWRHTINGNSHHRLSRRLGEDLLALTAGVGLGAGLMYVLDPDRGRSRRSQLMGEATGMLHRGEDTLQKRGKDLLNRVQGFTVRVAEEIAPEEQPTDEVLTERIRSRMGHIVANPHDVQVRVESGVVTLEGKLAHSERRRLRHEVDAMPGVKRVNAHLGSQPAFNPALLIGIGAGLALLRKTGPAAPKTNAA